ncbi:MAG: hypothetical protein U0571_11025 [Candidatus Brocadia sapporoensis]
MAWLRKPIDEFPNGLMVMVEDKTLRINRLTLPDQGGQPFLMIADFSKQTQISVL